VATHGGDASRVYVAGLSAGAAMAALLGQLYPDVFAAVGVHSGLVPGAARDVPSAFTAMRKGAPASSAALHNANKSIPPTIVFHGSADKTVHPGNGEQVMQAALDSMRASGASLTQTTGVEGDGARNTARTSYTDESGKPLLEYWNVNAGPHAWSGGNTAGSFTDPSGPSASRAMLEFFLRHSLRG
jgi:poly(3-hydroxybutyrate) depolymerase